MGKIRRFIRDVREDLKFYGKDGRCSFGKFLRYYFFHLGFFVLFNWRYAKLLRSLGIRGWPRLILKRHHIEISLHARIEGGVQIAHGLSVAIGEGAVIKRGATIYQCVSLGARRFGLGSASGRQYPIIEEDAIVYAGAVVVGPVTVGRGASVAANALLMEDVPPGKIARGNPASIVSDAATEEETGQQA